MRRCSVAVPVSYCCLLVSFLLFSAGIFWLLASVLLKNGVVDESGFFKIFFGGVLVVDIGVWIGAVFAAFRGAGARREGSAEDRRRQNANSAQHGHGEEEDDEEEEGENEMIMIYPRP